MYIYVSKPQIWCKTYSNQNKTLISSRKIFWKVLIPIQNSGSPMNSSVGKKNFNMIHVIFQCVAVIFVCYACRYMSATIIKSNCFKLRKLTASSLCSLVLTISQEMTDSDWDWKTDVSSTKGWLAATGIGNGCLIHGRMLHHEFMFLWSWISNTGVPV